MRRSPAILRKDWKLTPSIAVTETSLTRQETERLQWMGSERNELAAEAVDDVRQEWRDSSSLRTSDRRPPADPRHDDDSRSYSASIAFA